MAKDIPKNIEVFNHIVLYVLIQLYEKFPKPIDLDPSAIGLDARPDDNDENELWESMEIATHTLDWLEEEGFITIESKTLGVLNYSGVRLRLKGLTLLGYTPESAVGGKEQVSIINRAKAVFTKAAEQSATDVVGKLFIAGLQYLPRALG